MPYETSRLIFASYGILPGDFFFFAIIERMYFCIDQYAGVEPNSSEEPKSGENTSNKMGFGATSKSMEFTSPQNFHGAWT